MILLDTNVISALMRDPVDEQVVRWLNQQPRSSVGTTSINIFENLFGIHLLPEGKRRTALVLAFERVIGEALHGNIAGFDHAAAEQAAELEAARRRRGRPGDARDTMLAGIVLANHATLATRNVKHFEEIAKWVVNPWGNEK
jgi:predicted nucleic acid-binding protein